MYLAYPNMYSNCKYLENVKGSVDHMAHKLSKITVSFWSIEIAKSLCNIRQRFSYLLDEWIEKYAGKKITVFF